MNEERHNNNLTTADLASRKPEPDSERASNAAQAVENPTADHRNDRPVASQAPAESLMPESERSKYMEQWNSIQGTFVDVPKEAVEHADTLVADVIQQLAQKFAQQRQTLEQQWAASGEPSTEDLRQALQQYRSFFQRLLAA